MNEELNALVSVKELRKALIEGEPDTVFENDPSDGFENTNGKVDHFDVHCKALRERYPKFLAEDALGRSKETLGWYYTSPYHICPYEVLSPIEKSAWQAIKSGWCDFLPHFPVDKYILDFANPHFKIGIECDGKEWHSKEKDRPRDRMLASMGWVIFRVSGAKCHHTEQHPFGYIDNEDMQCGLSEEQQHRLRKYMTLTVEGLVRSIRHYLIGNQRSEWVEEHLPGVMRQVLFDNVSPYQRDYWYNRFHLLG